MKREQIPHHPTMIPKAYKLYFDLFRLFQKHPMLLNTTDLLQVARPLSQLDLSNREFL
jgi:hypothetical protein